ncbi:hypothetical protein [Qipengyuania nanhaisediminis]|uniref:hypothetical protein n=1 Tax=Qipengyuania nanhaisediminis TaxID=604088 RepID=UPI0038B2C811
MTDFEFIFVFYALLLGLSMVELLSGFGRTLENEFETEAQDRAFKIGWLTPILGFFVMLDLLSFWVIAWVMRDLVAVTPAMLLGVMAFTGAYYLAARLVFPTAPERFQDLDTHFFRVRRTIMGILITLVLAQWAFILSIPRLAEAMMTPLGIGLTLLLIALMAGVMIVRNRHIQAILLVALIVRYLVLYLV